MAPLLRFKYLKRLNIFNQMVKQSKDWHQWRRWLSIYVYNVSPVCTMSLHSPQFSHFYSFLFTPCFSFISPPSCICLPLSVFSSPTFQTGSEPLWAIKRSSSAFSLILFLSLFHPHYPHSAVSWPWKASLKLSLSLPLFFCMSVCMCLYMASHVLYASIEWMWHAYMKPHLTFQV